jgi:membrane protein YqaA with SNARE-associated domain
LLLSWLPMAGGSLTLAAGTLREPSWSFVVLVTVAKTARYLAIAAATLSWI